MPLRIGLTGKPRTGKSTIVKEVIIRMKAEGVPMGGMLTADLREHGRRVGFAIEDIRTGETGVLAHVQLPTRGPTVGKYTVNLTDLDGIGARSISAATARSEIELIIIDEIGTMELKSSRFIEAVEHALASEKHLVVTVHQRSTHELAQHIRGTFEILEVTEANRDEMATIIMKTVKNSPNGEG
ncbi:MAG: NTPase [Candidatus Methanospirareceae archaeon]